MFFIMYNVIIISIQIYTRHCSSIINKGNYKCIIIILSQSLCTVIYLLLNKITHFIKYNNLINT